jgi:hypothetical protein
LQRIALFILFAGCLTAIAAQAPGRNNDAPRAMAKPEVPFYDWNACPGEGCLYQEWTATKVVVVFDSYRAERRTIAQL